jgi:hypothetical protein
LTAPRSRLLRTVTFGTFDGGPWGVAWCSGEPLILLAPTADQPLRAIPQARIEGSAATEEWQLAGHGVELVVRGEGAPADIDAEPGPPGFDQLCRVQGSGTIDGDELAVDCLGVRSARDDVDVGANDSIRRVATWFDPDEAIALIAVRPRKAKGHGRDDVSASVLGGGGATVVADPRLSTTYAADGTPARAGLELWLEGEEGQQYPRRAAGESVAAGTKVAERDLELIAELFRWHSRGRDGAGVYLLARPA